MPTYILRGLTQLHLDISPPGPRPADADQRLARPQIDVVPGAGRAPRSPSTTVPDLRQRRGRAPAPQQRLAASFRLFGQFGFDEGLAGHITVRDPERPDHFWVNPLGMNFKLIRVKDLILVNDRGEVVDGYRR